MDAGVTIVKGSGPVRYYSQHGVVVRVEVGDSNPITMNLHVRAWGSIVPSEPCQAHEVEYASWRVELAPNGALQDFDATSIDRAVLARLN